MSINRVMGTAAIAVPEPNPVRGATGTFTLDLTGADVNPFPNMLQGKTDLQCRQDIQRFNNWACPTVINGGPPYDDNCMFVRGTFGYDVQIDGTIGIAAGQSGTATSQELGFLVCCGCTWNQVYAYEIMIAVHPTNLYSDVVRWNGNAIADQSGTTGFDILQHTTAGIVASQDGWLFRAQKVGNILHRFLNKNDGGGYVELGSGVDITSAPANPYGPNVYVGGLVGMNCWQRGGTTGDLTKIGWKSMSVTAP